MNYLAIDLGRAKTGLAYSEGEIATPLSTIRHTTSAQLLKKLETIVYQMEIGTIIIGYVEGKNINMYKNFAKLVKKEFSQLTVVLQDETLTTRHAQESMIKFQVPVRARKEKEDQYAAAAILNEFLEK